MNYSKFFVFSTVLFFGFKSCFVYANRLDALKNKPFISTQKTQKKVDTVVVKKKGSMPFFFLNTIKNNIGLSFLFERVIPRSWKKVVGLRRSIVIDTLTTITAIINFCLVGYGIIQICPFGFAKLTSYFQQYSDSKVLDQPKPLVPKDLAPAVPAPVIETPIELPSKPSEIDKKPIYQIGEFE